VPEVAAPALDGGPVHAVCYRDIAVLAHRCGPEPYQGSEEEVHGWIAAHNAVVEEAWEAGRSILPMSFDVIVRPGTGRSAEASLAGWLAEHYQTLCTRLAELAGRTEVGVQVLRDVSEPAGAAVPAAPARGREFFARQQHRKQARERLEQRADEDRCRYLGDLAPLADDMRVNKPRTVQGRQMVLNVSLLVTQAQVSRVGEYLETVSGEDNVEVRFTGPWPPYSFTGSLDSVEGNGEAAATAVRAGCLEADDEGY